ncbi:hypothetical protein [Lysinibacillus antri]|uniref:Swarming motility protein SwrB n=1 Tax=Lysinibacillus antri TaxID=2498145 RepID=A0A3S0QRF8_9BACI|nr:hypothetical protein [Lysinibacillus antri]RUL55779.1 hypothetical protein EK386_02905 [Lysinibacillus antri]
MTSFLIIILIIAQLISFYLIILLNTKIAKFKQLEIKQDKLIREMDDAISAYLIEMREENDRLIKELSNVKKTEIKQPIENEDKLVTLDRETVNHSIPSPKEDFPIADFGYQSRQILPKSMVKKAYQQQNPTVENTPTIDVSPAKQKDISTLSTFEQKVIQLHNEGNTIEQIAKITQKGKTEIELLLKFHS